MSHFAKVLDGKVVKVIVAEKEYFNTFIDESPGQWIQTSYNTYGNVHYGQDGEPDNGIALRGNYASIGHIYDKENDVFYAPSGPFPSWVLNKTNWLYECPVPMPTDGKKYIWDETQVNWVLSDSQ